MTTPTKFKFYAWHFKVGFNPHTVVVLAKTQEKAIAKALRCAQEQKIRDFAGPFTTDVRRIIKVGVQTSLETSIITFEDFIRKTQPTVMDSDCLISISALDG